MTEVREHEAPALRWPAPAELTPEEIEQILAEADHAIQLACLVQLTGDASLLAAYGPGTTQEPNPTMRLMPRTAMPEVNARVVRSWLAKLLAGNASPEVELPLPDEATFRRAAELVVGQGVPQEFLPLLREQAGFEPPQPVRPVTGPPPETLDLAIIGAGMAGINAAVQAQRRGYRYTVYERHHEVGGTWHEHNYPGVAVDTPSLYYSYSYELNPDWTDYYPSGEDFQAYLVKLVDDYEIRENIRFGVEMVSLRWSDGDQRWHITLRAEDGTVQETTAVTTAAAVGYLNAQSFPANVDRTAFAGLQFHSQDWDPALDLTGKRIAIVGAGATSMQIVPRIVDQVSRLTVFQRQAHWVVPKFSGEKEVGPADRWALRHLPFYNQWNRLKVYWYLSDNLYPNVRADKEWMETHEFSINQGNERVRQLCLKHIYESFGHDPEMVATMTPDHPPNSKRINKDPGGYYDALNRDNARVVTSAVTRVVPEGIVTADGELHELDVIVWATGYRLNFLSHFEIRGREGVALADVWGDAPSAYLGLTVPGFPNLFITSGPHASTAHGGGQNFLFEASTQYIMECLQLMVDRDARTLEVDREAHDAYNADMEKVLAGSIWCNTGSAHTYYLNKQGRPILPSPWRMVDFWTKLRTPVEEHFVLDGVPAGGER